MRYTKDTSAVFDRVDHTVTCAPPVFNPSGCSQYTGSLLPVTISTTTSGAQMRFTENGTAPSETVGTLINGTSGTAWIGTVVPVTLKAIAYKSGNYDSPITSGYYDNEDPNDGGHDPIHKGGEHKSQRTETNQPTSMRVVNYTLDNVGNRTQVVDGGVTKSYVPNNLNEYSTGNGLAVSNGASHEISSYNGTNYQYIGDSYLAKATSGTNSYTLFYDALGRCVKRTSVTNGGTAVTNYYIFDGEHWIAEYDSNGAMQSHVAYGLGMDELIAGLVKGVQCYYFQDRNGNISAVTDGINTVRESYRYDAFGSPTITVGAGQQPINNSFMFTGREWNGTYGFYEYRARAYNLTLGRFMSEDPKGFDAGDYNLYRYCHNDPLDRVDPMGLDDGPFESNISALQFLHTTVNPASIRANQEFRTKVYQNPTTKEYFTNDTAKGSSHKVAANGIPKGMVETADHHTHAAYGLQDGSGHVTRTDRVYKDNMNSDHPSAKDEKIWHAEGKGKKEYLGAVSTPGGKLIIEDATNPNSKPQEVRPLQPPEVIPQKNSH